MADSPSRSPVNPTTHIPQSPAASPRLEALTPHCHMTHSEAEVGANKQSRKAVQAQEQLDENAQIAPHLSPAAQLLRSDQLERPPPRGNWLQRAAPRLKWLSVLDGEIESVDRQIAQTLKAPHLAQWDKTLKLNSLKRLKRSHIASKNLHVLQDILKKAVTCVENFREDVLSHIESLDSAADIRQQLFSRPEYSHCWQELAEIPDCEDMHLRMQIDDTKAQIEKCSQECISALEQEYRFFLRQQEVMEQLPSTFQSTRSARDLKMENSAVATEREMERLQRDIDKMLLHISKSSQYPTATETSEQHNALKAAQYLKKRLRKMYRRVGDDDAYPEAEENTNIQKGDAPKRVWLEFDSTDTRGRKEFVGELHQECEHGLGVMSWMDGSTYRGEFKNGLSAGYGVEIYSDSSIYKGQFSNNLRHGLGVLQAPHGEQYHGEWLHGQRHGCGLLSIISGGTLSTVFGSFEHDHCAKVLHDDDAQIDFRHRVEPVVRQAIEMSQKAHTLCSDIKLDVKKGGIAQTDAKTPTEGFHGPVYQGPGTDVSHLDDEPVPKLLKAHEDLHSWLILYELGQFVHALQAQGFRKPSDLLSLLVNVDEFDTLAETCCLKFQDARVLWNAIETLSVIITPRSSTSDACGRLAAQDHTPSIHEGKDIDDNGKVHGPDLGTFPAGSGIAISIVEQSKIPLDSPLASARSLMSTVSEANAAHALSLATADERERSRDVEWQDVFENLQHVAYIIEAQEAREKQRSRDKLKRYRRGVAHLRSVIVIGYFLDWRDAPRPIVNERKRSRFAAIGLQATLRRMLVRGELETLRLLKSRNDAVLVLENALHRVLARGELETRRLLKSRNDAVLVLGNALHRSRLAQTDKRCVIQRICVWSAEILQSRIRVRAGRKVRAVLTLQRTVRLKFLEQDGQNQVLMMISIWSAETLQACLRRKADLQSREKDYAARLHATTMLQACQRRSTCKCKIPSVLLEAREQYHEQKEAFKQNIMSFVTGVFEITASSIEIVSATETCHLLPRAILVEFKEIRRLEVLYENEVKQAKAKYEISRLVQDIRKRSLKEREESRQRLLIALNRVREKDKEQRVLAEANKARCAAGTLCSYAKMALLKSEALRRIQSYQEHDRALNVLRQEEQRIEEAHREERARRRRLWKPVQEGLAPKLFGSHGRGTYHQESLKVHPHGARRALTTQNSAHKLPFVNSRDESARKGRDDDQSRNCCQSHDVIQNQSNHASRRCTGPTKQGDVMDVVTTATFGGKDEKHRRSAVRTSLPSVITSRHVQMERSKIRQDILAVYSYSRPSVDSQRLSRTIS